MIFGEGKETIVLAARTARTDHGLVFQARVWDVNMLSTFQAFLLSFGWLVVLVLNRLIGTEEWKCR